jgi:hypothetical protein
MRINHDKLNDSISSGKSHEVDLIESGHIKKALNIIRKQSQITDPDLIQKLCDLADPDIPKKRGRPSVNNDKEHQNKLLNMVMYYTGERIKNKKKGFSNPATVARLATLEYFNVGESTFEQAHKKYKNNWLVISTRVLTERYDPYINEKKDNLLDDPYAEDSYPHDDEEL